MGVEPIGRFHPLSPHPTELLALTLPLREFMTSSRTPPRGATPTACAAPRMRYPSSSVLIPPSRGDAGWPVGPTGPFTASRRPALRIGASLMDAYRPPVRNGGASGAEARFITPDQKGASATVGRSGAQPPLAYSAEDNIERPGQRALLGFGCWPQRDNQPRPGSGIAHAHQHAVALVLRLAGNIHLGDQAR